MPRLGLRLPKKRTITAPASLPKRFAGYFIDFVIIDFVIIYPFSRMLKSLIPSAKSASELRSYLASNESAMAMMIWLAAVIGIFAVAYFTYFEYRMQQTPGKMLMKNFIVPAKGKTLSLWNYLLSNLTFLPVFPFFLLWIIDPIYMFISPKNQRFMEKISNIVVMEKQEVY